MMMTDEKTWQDSLAIATHESEFQEPCSVPECGNQAEWLGWVAHSTVRCPNTSYACTVCKKLVDGWWAEVLARMGKCKKCGQQVSGLMEDNLRWIRL